MYHVAKPTCILLTCPVFFEINMFPTKRFHAFLFKMGRFCNTGPVFLHGHNPLALRRFGTLPTEAFGFQFDTVPTTPYFLDLTLCPHFSYQLDLYRHWIIWLCSISAPKSNPPFLASTLSLDSLFLPLSLACLSLAWPKAALGFQLPSQALPSDSVQLRFSVFTYIMCCLMTGIHYKKCILGQFPRCANIIECAYTNLNGIVYYTPRLWGIAYCF